ncbi:MAG: PIN domain-containing protein [Terracidiphilus sp.]|jgi:predicted nucleic acid-binding protein
MMKVIVDTCVWSLSLRRGSAASLKIGEQQMVAQLRQAIQDGNAAIIGPIRQEILSGIRDKAHFARTEGLLDPFRDEEITASDYVEAARLYNLCRDHGVECGSLDILICAVAVRNHYDILTSDAGLGRCISVLRGVYHIL